MSIIEGQFERGKQHGYSRKVMSKDGSAIVGFYNDGEPFGKWSWYKSDGALYMPEGIYYCMDCINECQLDSFVFNQEPHLSKDTIKSILNQIVNDSVNLIDE